MFANFRERCGLLPGGGALDRCGPAWARGDGPTLQPCSGTVQKTARQTTGAVPRAGHPSPQNTLAYSRNARTVTPPGTRSVPVERARKWPIGFSQERSGSRHPYLPRQIGQALKTAHVSLRCVQRTTSGANARVPGKSGTGGDATHVKHNTLTVNQERESMFRMETTNAAQMAKELAEAEAVLRRVQAARFATPGENGPCVAESQLYRKVQQMKRDLERVRYVGH